MGRAGLPLNPSDPPIAVHRSSQQLYQGRYRTTIWLTTPLSGNAARWVRMRKGRCLTQFCSCALQPPNRAIPSVSAVVELRQVYSSSRLCRQRASRQQEICRNPWVVHPLGFGFSKGATFVSSVRRVAGRGRSRFVPASGGDIALQRIKVALPFLSHLLFALALIVRGGNERHGFVDFDQYN